MAKHYSLGIYDYDRTKICELYDSNVDLLGQAYDIKYTEDNDGYHTLEFNIPFMIDAKQANAENLGSYYGKAIWGTSRFGIAGADSDVNNFRWDFLRSDYLIRYTEDDKNVWFVANKPTKSKSSKKITGSATCSGFESLLKTRNIYKYFDDENGIGTIDYLMTQIMKGTGWTYSPYYDATTQTYGLSDQMIEKDGVTEKVRSLTSDGKQGALGLISTVCNLFQARPVFDTDRMIVYVKARNNRVQVVEGEIGRNLTALTVKHDSSNISTRVYIEGEYGDYGYVGIDDVLVDANGNPDPSGTAWGLPFLLNFDYYRQLGVFKASHETALANYLTAIRAKKAQISAKGVELTECENSINNLIGQCKLALYYKPVSTVTPNHVYGDLTDDQKILHTDDDIIVLKNNGTISYEKWLNQSYQLDGAYGVIKFVTPSAGKIGAAETQIAAKEQEIEKLKRKIDVCIDPETGRILKPDKVAEYTAEIYRLQDEIDSVFVGYPAYSSGSTYIVNDYCMHNTSEYGDNHTYLTAKAYKCITAITEPHEWDASEWTEDNFIGLFKMMHDIAKTDGLIYDLENIEVAIVSLNAQQDDIEATFIAAMGFMLRDGYWSNQNYVPGQETILYLDAQDMTKEMAYPTTDITFSYVRLTEEYDIQPEDIEINAIFRIWDEDLSVEENMFVKKITYGVDNKSLGQIEVSNQDIALTGSDLGTLLSRMSQLADLIEQKNALYERAKAISASGSIYASRLNGQIDVMKNQILSSVSNWYTDERGNMVFVAADESSAMMLSGAGLMLASGHTDDGSWDWRSCMDGHGLSADEIIAGFLSADRIEAGTITVNKLNSDVATSLDLSSNQSINLIVQDIEEEIGFRLEIVSTSDILSEDISTTTLSAVVWHGSEDVTDTLAASKFNWKRVTNNSSADATWNNNHKAMKSITLTCADVDYSATYSCELSS